MTAKFVFDHLVLLFKDIHFHFTLCNEYSRCQLSITADIKRLLGFSSFRCVLDKKTRTVTPVTPFIFALTDYFGSFRLRQCCDSRRLTLDFLIKGVLWKNV